MNADGSSVRQLTKDRTIAIDPHFSPDGKTILYWADGGLYTVRSDGSESPKVLVAGSGRELRLLPARRSVRRILHGPGMVKTTRFSCAASTALSLGSLLTWASRTSPRPGQDAFDQLSPLTRNGFFSFWSHGQTAHSGTRRKVSGNFPLTAGSRVRSPAIGYLTSPSSGDPMQTRNELGIRRSH